MFVVRQESSEVQVYDLVTFGFRHLLYLKVIQPADIGSCDVNTCLYIFDYKGHLGQSNEILRVDPHGNLITKWTTGLDYGFHLGGGLSVTNESTIILTVSYKNKLNEYSQDGTLICEIMLPTDSGIRHPWHAVKLSNGQFVVSHGDVGELYDLHRVCIVNADGDIEKSFGGKRGSIIGQMNFPYYLSVDGNGFVMVADIRNSRVLLLDSELKFKKEILSKEHGLQRPERILLDKPNGRLFVADNKSNNQRVLIFDLGQSNDL